MLKQYNKSIQNSVNRLSEKFNQVYQNKPIQRDLSFLNEGRTEGVIAALDYLRKNSLISRKEFSRLTKIILSTYFCMDKNEVKYWYNYINSNFTSPLDD